MIFQLSIDEQLRPGIEEAMRIVADRLLNPLQQAGAAEHELNSLMIGKNLLVTGHYTSNISFRWRKEHHFYSGETFSEALGKAEAALAEILTPELQKVA